jgi:hypothetical protein
LDSKNKILYIMGAGRSGTTILEILLKASDGVAGFGEMSHFIRDGVQLNKRCSCGEVASKCIAWGNNYMHFSASNTAASLMAINKVESHSRFLKNALVGFDELMLRSYSQDATSMFTSLNTEVNTILVDSSKYPGRALALQKIFGDQLVVVAVTRDPGELLEAFKKKNNDEQKPKSNTMAALYFFYVLTCMFVAKTKLKKVVCVRYEDLVTSPSKVLTNIEECLTINLEGSRRAIKENLTLTPGHIITGNRLRNQDDIRFKVKSSYSKPELGIFGKFYVVILNVYRNILGF